jgi:hypothetical protein
MTTLRDINPGQRIRIIEQHPRFTGDLKACVEGVVLRFGQAKTGSWYAHSRDGKLWLDRVELKKDDGELAVVNLDQYSAIEILK